MAKTSGQIETNDGKSKSSESASADHASEADLVKLHLRHDKDLNKAYPLDEKNPLPPSPRKGD